MKKIFLILTIFLLPLTTQAMGTYTRTPSGSNITSPVEFYVNSTDPVNDFDGILSWCAGQWAIALYDIEGNVEYSSTYIATTTLTQNWEVSLPIGYSAYGVAIECNAGGSVDLSPDIWTNDIDPPSTADYPIFTIISNVGVNNYLSIPNTAGLDLFAYAGGLVSDFWVLLAIALGVPLAFYLINKVIDLMPSEKKSREAIKRADRVIAESKKLQKRL